VLSLYCIVKVTLCHQSIIKIGVVQDKLSPYTILHPINDIRVISTTYVWGLTTTFYANYNGSEMHHQLML